MRGKRQQFSLLQCAARLVLLLPMLVGLLLPRGYMPDFSKDGTVTIVLCTSTGVQSVVIDRETGLPAPAKDLPGSKHSDKQSGICAFASVLTFANIDFIPASHEPFFTGARFSFVAGKQQIIAGRHDRPGARAPPAQV